MVLEKLILIACIIFMSGCTVFSTRTDTNSQSKTDMVREETHISQEYHDGQIIELKKTVYITEVSKEVAAIKSNRDTTVPTGGMNLSTLLTGGGLGTLILGLVGKRLYERIPPKRTTPPDNKARREED